MLCATRRAAEAHRLPKQFYGIHIVRGGCVVLGLWHPELNAKAGEIQCPSQDEESRAKAREKTGRDPAAEDVSIPVSARFTSTYKGILRFRSAQVYDIRYLS
eukprot:scaffold256_cov261-Pinguiococcus_pyrenoidosus.AAC.33